MTHPYDNQYAPDNVYGHAVALLEKFGLPRGGIHLDFGCGFGAMAETIRDKLGLRYVGLDILQEGLETLQARGFEAMHLDLSNPQGALSLLEQWLPAGTPVVSMSVLDVMEHLTDPARALDLLGRLARKHGCPLVLSVPNVGHRDVGFRLLAGKFEYTESGLLDRTHYQYFTGESLDRLMHGVGFHENYRNDVLMEASDQNFPADLALLSPGTPINALLRHVRDQADANGTVNQFVRAYLPVAAPVAAEEESVGGPFITVVTRTEGKRDASLRETLLCLSAQTDQDFELIVVGHALDLERQLRVERAIADQHASMRSRTRLLKVDRGARAAPLNAAFAAARGAYVVMLDDDDLVFGNWIETFRDLHRDNPGKLLRATAVSQQWDMVQAGAASATRCMSGYKAQYADRFDLLDHLVENRTPLHSIAFPRSVHRDLGVRFDESLTTAEDWDFIIRVAPLAGVADTPAITAVYRRWANTETSAQLHGEHEWEANYRHTLRKVDALPLLLPAGSTRRLRALLHEVSRARGTSVHDPLALQAGGDVDAAYLEALRWRLHQLVNSHSWRYTAWFRMIRHRLAGRRPPELVIWRLDVPELERWIASIEHSRTWRMTARLRDLRRGRPE